MPRRSLRSWYVEGVAELLLVRVMLPGEWIRVLLDGGDGALGAMVVAVMLLVVIKMTT